MGRTQDSQLRYRIASDDRRPFPHVPGGDDAAQDVRIGAGEVFDGSAVVHGKDQDPNRRAGVGARPCEEQFAAVHRRPRMSEMLRAMRRPPFEVVGHVLVEEEEMLHVAAMIVPKTGRA